MGGPSRLLIVDDEPFVLSALTRLLRRDGYEVVTAPGPNRGIEVLQAQGVGVIISDYRMPEMDGVEFLRRAREVVPDAIRIILSGYAETHAILSAVNDGGIHKYLTKPWNGASPPSSGHRRKCSTRAARCPDRR